MKVIQSEENLLEFDNGLRVLGTHSQDCCEHNFLDFEQIPSGTEFEDMDATTFVKNITLKEDGFSIKAKDGLPKWVQARSSQNGYYSSHVQLTVADRNTQLDVNRPGQESYAETFNGETDETY